MAVSRRWLAGALLVTACTPAPLTQLVVGIRVTATVPTEADRLEVIALLPSGERRTSVALTAAGELHTLGLRHVDGPLGSVVVRASATRGGVERIVASTRTEFVRGESRLVTLELASSCLGVACEAGETCRDGACVSDAIAGTALPAWEGTFPMSPRADAARDASAGADAGMLDAWSLDVFVPPDPDAHVPDAHVPDAYVPDAYVPDAYVPALPDATSSFPDASAIGDVGRDAPIPDAYFRLDATFGTDAGRDAGSDAFVDNCFCAIPTDRCAANQCTHPSATCSPVTSCPTNYACSGTSCVCNDANLCGARCYRDSQCPAGNFCVGAVGTTTAGRCARRIDECNPVLAPCPSGQLCGISPEWSRRICTPLGSLPGGATCSSPTECASGVCSAICLTACDENSDCGATLRCSRVSGNSVLGCVRADFDACTSSCTAAASACIGSCSDLCRSNAECPAGTFCSMGFRGRPICDARPNSCAANELFDEMSGRCTQARLCSTELNDCPSGLTCRRFVLGDPESDPRASTTGICQR